MPKVLVVQHVVEEGCGRLGPALERASLDVEVVAPDAPLAASALDGEDVRGLVVLGGPMGVGDVDRHPRLRDELLAIERALARGLPILGICLGSQLLATALGATVSRARAIEIGWLDVTLSAEARRDPLFLGAPETFSALHWHGDVFAQPAGTRPLGRSAATDLQAFSYRDQAWGVLFHLEADEEQLVRMATAFPDDVVAAGTSVEALRRDAVTHAEKVSAIAASVFDAWAAIAKKSC